MCYNNDSDYRFEAKMNYSKQRETILKVLRSTRSHPSVNWIYENVKKEIPDVGLATVYRNLKQLEAAGEIMRIQGDFPEERWDGFAHNHAHFVCTKCKKILDMDIDGSLKLKILSACPVKADDFYVVYTGTCDECNNKTN